MRWVYLTVVVLFVAAAIIFIFQNVGIVTMSFLGLSVRAPLAVLASSAQRPAAACSRCCANRSRGRARHVRDRTASIE